MLFTKLKLGLIPTLSNEQIHEIFYPWRTTYIIEYFDHNVVINNM